MSEKFKSRPFYYKLTGDYALFTDPATKGGGEKMTYQVPTYQALKGISEQIYWKPTIKIYIDEVKVMNKIKTETMGARPIHTTKAGNDLSYYTYLADVEYLVKFYFVWNMNRGDLAQDRNENKHVQMMFRSLERGGRRSIFLGTSECMGFVEKLNEGDYYHAKSHYEGQKLNYGVMFHSFIYPDEAFNEDTEGVLTANFSPITMENGVIKFDRPEDCTITNVVRDYQIKSFNADNVKSVDEEIAEIID